MKQCSKCGENKPLDAFSKQTARRDGLRSMCKACDKAYYDANPQVQRAANLRAYGVTTEQYDLLLAEQHGVCALCHESCETGRRLAVDHHHVTGEVRGLLCKACNTALERVETVAGWAERASSYLGVPA